MSHSNLADDRLNRDDIQNGDDHEQEELLIEGRPRLLGAMPSWLVSFFLHVMLILLLALVFLPDNTQPPIAFEVSDVSGEQLESLDVDLNSLELDSALSSESLVTPEMNLAEMPLPEVETESVPVDALTEMSADFQADLKTLSGGSEFSGRTSEGRASEGRASAKAYGASAESEQSVDLALEWLANHQLPNGSWNFDHSIGPGERSKLDPGTYTDCVNAATAMALLPFLGAGNTHVNGTYKDNVQRGLAFLINNVDRDRGRYSWMDRNGGMYSHGMAAIAFCEAYAMTDDHSLLEYAEGAVRFIEYAQDPRGGGWRYEPREPGDTSVVGWQVMALKSAKMAGIKVEDSTWKLAKRFLDSVSVESGAYYGYMNRPNQPYGLHKSRIAIGLLCRMYMGWEKERPGLADGVMWLGDYRPSTGTRENPNGANMYYNYYATQVMRHYGGEMWKKWNGEMRDYLVEQQATEGNERGSWYFDRSDDMSPEAGGRLYCTAMSAMTLEVYYRFLPLYGSQAMEGPDDFPLD